jgi:ubiquinone biosynthesis protein UbiJ
MPGSGLFPALCAGVLEDAVARLLALDPHSANLLRPLAGKVLALRVSPFSTTVFLYVTANGLQIHPKFEREPDASLTGTPAAFARLGFGASAGDLGGQVTGHGTRATPDHESTCATTSIPHPGPLPAGEGDQGVRFATFTVTVEGDAETAQCVRTLLETLQIDWEGRLANRVGVSVAERVFGAVRAGRRLGNETLATLAINVAEYLQEESRALPAAAEAGEFLREVDSLRADCERLEARVASLSAASGSARVSGHGLQG